MLNIPNSYHHHAEAGGHVSGEVSVAKSWYVSCAKSWRTFREIEVSVVRRVGGVGCEGRRYTFRRDVDVCKELIGIRFGGCECEWV